MVFDPESLGFAPGTLIQTLDDGPLPIEQIRVGMQVLAQPEAGGEQAYRQVLNTVAHLDQEVYAVQVKVAGADSLTTLFATGGHPFWVEAPLVDSEHWMAMECLEPGFVLQLADGSKATVHAAGLIRQTQFPEIGFAADERAGVGIVLDLSARQAKLASDAVALKLGPLELGEAWLTPVYNFEVEEFHTYYVGEVGVWVHNSTCGEAEAATAAFDKRELESLCFASDTLVMGEFGHPMELGYRAAPIQTISVGERVLSRCEKSGEMALKRVVKVYERDVAMTYRVSCNFGPEYRATFGVSGNTPIVVTPEHPFWVEGKGWTAVRDLQPGDVFFTYNGERTTVLRIVQNPYRQTVYNLEVEDFNTYFVEMAGIWVHNCNNAKIETDRLAKIEGIASRLG